MTSVDIKEKPNDVTTGGGGNNNLDNFRSGGGGGDDSNDKNKTQPKEKKSSPMLFLLFAIIPIVMFFGAIIFVYIVREMGKVWKPISMPSAVISSTLVLIVSSFTLEIARSALKNKLLEKFKRWVMISTVLGIAFFTSQLVAWKQLMAKGVYMEATNPHATFFYILTGVHALHLLGGLIGLAYVLLGAMYYRFTAEKRAAVDVATGYWHFMDVLWIVLFVLLFVWK